MCATRSTIDVDSSNVCNLLPLERTSVLMANQTWGLIKTHYTTTSELKFLRAQNKTLNRARSTNR